MPGPTASSSSSKPIPTTETGQGILSTLLTRPSTPTYNNPLSHQPDNNQIDKTRQGSTSMAHRPAFHHAATDTTRGAGLLLSAGVDTNPGMGMGMDGSSRRGSGVRDGGRDGQRERGYEPVNPMDDPYAYPSEKHSPPPLYTRYSPSLSIPSFSPSAEYALREGLERCTAARLHAQTQQNPAQHPALLPPIDLAKTGMLQCMKRKLMGKEGGMGMALMLGWVVTTVGFVLATAFWRGELFGALDRLSKHLHSLGLQGKAIFLLLILITTIPPLPLYSTLMVLAGYTFGVWEGFVVSYIASLAGAVLVFVVSRCWLRDVISRSLQSSPTAQTLLSIIPANPHLLLLIRIAPYPYNLLNVILASAPSLSLRTYTACTAISLLKLVLHTWIGAGIHDIASFGSHPHHGHGQSGHHSPHGLQGGGGGYEGPYPGVDAATAEGARGSASGYDYVHGEHERGGRGGWHGYGSYGDTPWPHAHAHAHGHGFPHEHGYGQHHGYEFDGDHAHRMRVKMYATWVGIALCVGLFFYLTHLAKKALRKAQAEEEARREGGVRLMGSDEEC